MNARDRLVEALAASLWETSPAGVPGQWAEFAQHQQGAPWRAAADLHVTALEQATGLTHETGVIALRADGRGPMRPDEDTARQVPGVVSTVAASRMRFPEVWVTDEAEPPSVDPADPDAPTAAEYEALRRREQFYRRRTREFAALFNIADGGEYMSDARDTKQRLDTRLERAEARASAAATLATEWESAAEQGRTPAGDDRTYEGLAADLRDTLTP